jgi:hypothetical protein
MEKLEIDRRENCCESKDSDCIENVRKKPEMNNANAEQGEPEKSGDQCGIVEVRGRTELQSGGDDDSGDEKLCDALRVHEGLRHTRLAGYSRIRSWPNGAAFI